MDDTGVAQDHHQESLNRVQALEPSSALGADLEASKVNITIWKLKVRKK